MKNLRQASARKPSTTAATPAAPVAPAAPATPPPAPATTTETPAVVTPGAPTPAQPPTPPPVPNRIMPAATIFVRAVAGCVASPEGPKRRGETFHLPEDRFRAMGKDVERVREDETAAANP